MEQRFDIETAVAQLQVDVEHLRDQHDTFQQDVTRLEKFITGNGDPSKGLLWLVTDLGKMMTSLTNLVTDQSKMLTEHINKDHRFTRTESSWQSRLAYDVTKQVAVVLVSVLLILVVVGFQAWVQRPPVP